MDQQAWDRINTLENDIRKAHTNDVCLYPGCREKPIGSHLIAEQTLKMIAQEGHVLTWLPTTSYALLKSVEAGKPLETWDEEPVPEFGQQELFLIASSVSRNQFRRC